MEFKLTEDTLQRLEQKEEITVRDIMGFVVTDICRDLQNGCGELTRLKLGNDDQEEDDAILFICNLARKLAKIQSRNQEKFDDPDHRPVWNGANKKLQEAMEQLTSIEEEINKKQQIVAELEETLQKIGDNRAKIDEYEKLIEEKENAIRLAESIEEKCQELREETAQIKETKIPAVMQQQKVREDEFQAAGQKLENEKQKYQQYIAEQEKELEIKKQEIQQHIAEMDQKLENKKQGLQPHISELNQKNQELQDLEERVEDLHKKKTDTHGNSRVHAKSESRNRKRNPADRSCDRRDPAEDQCRQTAPHRQKRGILLAVQRTEARGQRTGETGRKLWRVASDGTKKSGRSERTLRVLHKRTDSGKRMVLRSEQGNRTAETFSGQSDTDKGKYRTKQRDL